LVGGKSVASRWQVSNEVHASISGVLIDLFQWTPLHLRTWKWDVDEEVWFYFILICGTELTTYLSRASSRTEVHGQNLSSFRTQVCAQNWSQGRTWVPRSLSSIWTQVIIQ
jgi:hypothetical protein